MNDDLDYIRPDQIYGKRLWNLLHTTAADYPEKPNASDKLAAQQFVEVFMRDGIEHEEWGSELMDQIEAEGPIDVSSRKNFSIWVCKQHNKVN